MRFEDLRFDTVIYTVSGIHKRERKVLYMLVCKGLISYALDIPILKFSG